MGTTKEMNDRASSQQTGRMILYYLKVFNIEKLLQSTFYFHSLEAIKTQETNPRCSGGGHQVSVSNPPPCF